MAGNRKTCKWNLICSLSFAVMMIVLCSSAAYASDVITIEIPDLGGIYDTDSLDESDRLAAGFINSILMPPEESFTKRGSTLGDRLTGTSHTLYTLLRNDISDIANGYRSSAVMVYEASSVYGQTEFNAEQLGVDSIVEGGSITQAAINAISDIIAFDVRSVIRALLADCPYDLYWYDKTAGFSISFPQSISATNTTISFSGDVTASLCVASEYAVNGENYVYDTSYGQSARDAAALAASIANQYSAATDQEKLVGFASEICSMVDYNYDALGEGTPYGNPWQIIWVFDDNTLTNVVCEGYSKAFQYLCDLSTFSGDIRVITVTGTMIGATGSGPHMWNVVRLEDGFNYLVDVTNVDAGTAGYPDQLMLVAPGSGDYNEGYSFETTSGTIDYEYDDTTKGNFRSGELILGNYYAGMHCITLPAGTQIIESEALAGIGTQVIIIPESCTSVAEDAFDNCANLVYIINHSTAEITAPQGVELIVDR